MTLVKGSPFKVIKEKIVCVLISFFIRFKNYLSAFFPLFRNFGAVQAGGWSSVELHQINDELGS